MTSCNPICPSLASPCVTSARQLNVSHTTISRALRNDPEISRPMRERVQAAARETGYRPDPMLSALAHYRRSRNTLPVAAELAWINHWPNPRKLRTFKEFNLYWKGAFEEADRCGFRLEEFVLEQDMTLARLENILRARNIRGILLPPRVAKPPPELPAIQLGGLLHRSLRPLLFLSPRPPRQQRSIDRWRHRLRSTSGKTVTAASASLPPPRCTPASALVSSTAR